jgi:3',5'-cyclic-AMP phosphodiesterase
MKTDKKKPSSNLTVRPSFLFSRNILCLCAFAFLIFAQAAVSSCVPVFSMHQTKVPVEKTQMNRKNKERISSIVETPSLPNSRFRVGILSDSHSDYEDFEKTVEVINKRNDLDFIILTGDFTNLGMLWEFERADEILRKLKVPVIAVMGNHDAVGFGRDIYLDMFGPENFVLEHKGVRFVAWHNSKLERNLPKQDLGSLEDLLKKPTKTKKTIVFSHIPPTEPEPQIFSQSEKQEFHNLLKKHHVAASVHGHRHAFGWQNLEGLDYITQERVRGVNYGVLTFDSKASRALEYDWCKASGCTSMESTVRTVPW